MVSFPSASLVVTFTGNGSPVLVVEDVQMVVQTVSKLLLNLTRLEVNFPLCAQAM
jgi:hypothetical protein